MHRPIRRDLNLSDSAPYPHPHKLTIAVSTAAHQVGEPACLKMRLDHRGGGSAGLPPARCPGQRVIACSYRRSAASSTFFDKYLRNLFTDTTCTT
jgi:hypothetical protein